MNGPAGAGKSTIAEKVWKTISRTALIHLDEIKWMISDCRSDGFDLSLALKVGERMTETYLKNGVDVIIEKAFNEQQYLQPLQDLGEELADKVCVYNIEAPLKVLIERVSREREQRRPKDLKRYWKVETPLP